MLAAVLSSSARAGDCVPVQDPVDYVNPYMGNISHVLQPTFPVVHLPNGMLKVRPERPDYTCDRISGLGMAMPSYISSSLFRISPWNERAGNIPGNVIEYVWDNEDVTPYSYKVTLMEPDVDVLFAPSYQAAVYELDYNSSKGNVLLVNSEGGIISAEDGVISGSADAGEGTTQYIHIETDVPYTAEQRSPSSVLLEFPDGTGEVTVRYGISYISTEQAEKNLRSSIDADDVWTVMRKGRDEWNKVLSRVYVEGGSQNDRVVLYTSLYRTYNRMINISEDGKYYSAFDARVHDDGGIPFYTDDWFWDTYKCVHPLRTIIDADKERDMVSSMIRMAEQSSDGWLPTFPQVQGDSHRMNGNHGIIVIADAMSKGLVSEEDVEKALEISKRTFFGKTHAPWMKAPAGEYDEFYHGHGYFPGLRPGEEEKYRGIHDWERRQSVAVSLAASYDAWAISQMASRLGDVADMERFKAISENYRLLYNDSTDFFHPKDEDGNFITPFDYKLSGGMGARDYYDENNAWTYRWDLQHDIPGLIAMMGGNDKAEAYLDQMFREDLGAIRWDFWDQFPDHTGIVGQFSMGNEPSMHIPYIYNYTGSPWKTQKRVRNLMRQWFRNDLMGVPGDEDGGGLSAFAVFSAIGIYPVTPGMPCYTLGSPVFSRIVLTTDDGTRFEIVAEGCSEDNKYIQSATLDGKPLEGPWISHEDITGGGRLTLVMSDRPAKEWGRGNSRPVSVEKHPGHETSLSDVHAGSFVHPGIDMTAEDLAVMKDKVLAGEEPWATAYRNLLASSPSTNIDMKGPDLFPEQAGDTLTSLSAVTHVVGGAYNNPDIGATAILEAADAAYDHALIWYVGGDSSYAESAKSILMDWAATFRSLDDNNAKLLAALSGYQFCNAAEILRYCWSGWTDEDTRKFTEMLMRVYYPYLRFYFSDANGNWDGAIMHSLLAIAVFTDNRDIFDDAVHHYRFASENGSLFKYIYPSGQCQETPRDQAHVQMGLAEFGGAARIAATQGVDLFSLGGARLAAGLEYTAKFLLGEPSFVYGVQSPRRMDELREDLEYFYRQYRHLGIDTPYLRELCEKVRGTSGRGVLTGFRAEFAGDDGKRLRPVRISDTAYPAGALDKAAPVSRTAVIVRPGDDIQAAIDTADGRQILLKSGMHEISEPLLVRTGTRLSGEGINTVIMTSRCKSHFAMVNASDDMSDVFLSDFVIEGAADHNQDPDPNGGRFNRIMRYSNNRGGINFSATSEGLLENIVMKNISVVNFSKNGVNISGAGNVRLEACNISDNGSGIIPGPRLQHNLNISYARNVRISGCRFDTSLAGCGIEMMCCENVVVRDCEIARNAWHGVHVGDCRSVTVSGCLIEANDCSGVRCEKFASGNSGITVSGNAVQFNGGSGVYADAGEEIVIRRNRYEDNSPEDFILR